MKVLDPKLALKLINFYPPYLGAGIRVRTVSDDIRTITVQMKLTFWNRNAVGTHFGGSLYAMCDPFYMFILMHALGRDYIVWDRAASIDFLKPGKSTVTATFHIADEEIERVRRAAEDGNKVEPKYVTQVLGADGEVVASVNKTLYVRKKARLGPRRPTLSPN